MGDVRGLILSHLQMALSSTDGFVVRRWLCRPQMALSSCERQLLWKRSLPWAHIKCVPWNDTGVVPYQK
ncbi:MAG TPA: hypothetical protein VFD23_05695 [Clostridia bacterium]|nr:hypothetical protein [Clostridia bacterium]